MASWLPRMVCVVSYVTGFVFLYSLFRRCHINVLVVVLYFRKMPCMRGRTTWPALAAADFASVSRLLSVSFIPSKALCIVYQYSRSVFHRTHPVTWSLPGLVHAGFCRCRTPARMQQQAWLCPGYHRRFGGRRSCRRSLVRSFWIFFWRFFYHEDEDPVLFVSSSSDTMPTTYIYHALQHVMCLFNNFYRMWLPYIWSIQRMITFWVHHLFYFLLFVLYS